MYAGTDGYRTGSCFGAIWRTAIAAVLTLGAAVTWADPLPQRQHGEYTLGCIPAFNEARLFGAFEPLFDTIAVRAGMELYLETAADFPTFVHRAVAHDRYDIVFVPPNMVPELDAKGYRLLVRMDGYMNAVFVTAIPSPGGLKALAGAEIAAIDPPALVGIAGRAAVENAQPPVPVTWVATPSHEATLRALFHGRVAAAVLPGPYLRHRVDPELRSRLHVVHETPPLPNAAILAAPSVKPEHAERLRQVLLQVDDDPVGRELLARGGWPGFVAVDPAEYRRTEFTRRPAQ